ncbi:MAG TPA: hypothetical protein VN200_06950 [Rhodoglobus sp.]|nr:hypothetical protein [Rhodoglobus sp.]
MNPNLFRYEGRTWVSETPPVQARAALEAQRAWDAQTARAQRWWVAIVIGAVLGTATVLGLGVLSGAPGFLYLIVLPLGFAFGAVLGALANKRFNPGALQAPSTPRPPVPELHRVHSSVLRRIPADATAAQIIELVRR